MEDHRWVVSEEIICESFRCYQGKGYYLGVKCQWWAKLVEDEEEEACKVVRNIWRPTQDQITIADRLLFVILPKLTLRERKILIARCGKGYSKSYRKCGKEFSVHHEVFRKEFQQVIEKVQKVLDEE